MSVKDVMIPILLASSFCVNGKPFWVRLVWAIFMPVAASFIGFISMDVWFYLSDQGNPFNISFLNWLAVNLVGPQFTAKIYKVSIMLSMFCIVEHFVFRRGYPRYCLFSKTKLSTSSMHEMSNSSVPPSL